MLRMFANEHLETFVHETLHTSGDCYGNCCLMVTIMSMKDYSITVFNEDCMNVSLVSCTLEFVIGIIIDYLNSR